jgi:hypothetical protein
MDKLAQLQPAVTEAEIDTEIAAARAERARRRGYQHRRLRISVGRFAG